MYAHIHTHTHSLTQLVYITLVLLLLQKYSMEGPPPLTMEGSFIVFNDMWAVEGGVMVYNIVSELIVSEI